MALSRNAAHASSSVCPLRGVPVPFYEAPTPSPFAFRYGRPMMTLPFDAAIGFLATLSPATVAGAVAVTTNCIWPLLGSRRRILAVQVGASALFALHYSLLGANTGAAMCAAGALQGIAVSSLRKRWARDGLFAATIVASLAVTAFTWVGMTSLLALGGQSLSALGRLQRGAQAIRLAFLGSEVFWVSHNVLVGSSWGLTSDAMAVTMLLIGLWRGRDGRKPAAAVAAAAAGRA